MATKQQKAVLIGGIVVAASSLIALRLIGIDAPVTIATILTTTYVVGLAVSVGMAMILLNEKNDEDDFEDRNPYNK